MEVGSQAQLQFHGVDFPVINFNFSKPRLEENGINLSITPKVFYPKDQPGFFRIIQEVRISSEDSFDLYLLAVGSFEISSEASEELKKNFVNSNAPAIMFPYMRSFVATLTANLGGNTTGTLNIPTQFFRGELEEITEPQEQQ